MAKTNIVSDCALLNISLKESGSDFHEATKKCNEKYIDIKNRLIKNGLNEINIVMNEINNFKKFTFGKKQTVRINFSVKLLKLKEYGKYSKIILLKDPKIIIAPIFY